MNWLYFLIIGAISGWLAGQLMKGSGFGLIGNIILGVIGAVVGGWLFSVLGIKMDNDTLGSIITSVAGAAVVLFVAGLFKK